MPICGWGAQVAAGGSPYNVIWPLWNGAYQTASATSWNYTPVTVIWSEWNVSYAVGAASTSAAYFVPYFVPTALPEEIARREAAAAARRALRETADAKANRLLQSVLSADQRGQYERERTFDVIVGRSGATRRYRIKHGWAGKRVCRRRTRPGD